MDKKDFPEWKNCKMKNCVKDSQLYYIVSLIQINILLKFVKSKNELKRDEKQNLLASLSNAVTE